MTPQQYEEYWQFIDEIKEACKNAIEKDNWTLFDLKCKALRESCRDDLFLQKRYRCIYLPTSIYGLPLLPPD